jgi:outer membrane protein assembly factor BamA
MLLRNLRLIFFLPLFFLFQLPTVGSAQTTDTSFVVIKRLVIAGNHITKPQVIIREMMIKEGDTIDVSLLEKVLSRSKDNLMNLGIFNFVDIKTAMDPGVGLTLLVNVSERWYIIPIPQFELVDRNFNEWVRSGDLGRVNYGLNLDWTNFRGMNETIKLQFKWGYTRKIGLSYQLPFINKNQNEGLSFSGSYTLSKELGYGVDDSRLLLYKADNGYAREEFSVGSRYTRRSGHFNSSFLGLDYRSMMVADTIVKLNRDYLSPGLKGQQMLTVSWGFRRDLRDYKYYPLNGYLFDIEAARAGWGFIKNETEWMYLAAMYRKYLPLSERWHTSLSLKGKLSGQSETPYWVQRGFGYGNDLVRGYEYYVVPGQNFVLIKSNVKFTLLKTKVVSLPLPISEKFRTIPNAFYLNAGFESGYVRDRMFAQENPLANTWQFGYGIGLDYVTYYNLVFSVEYSLNRMGESGLFLHFAAPI